MVDQYHHGDLRNAILDRALGIITDDGVAALSLRGVAAELGVSHAAPRHHFATKTALLTAIAARGYRELAGRMAAAMTDGGDFLDVGVAYVEFALEDRATFGVMFDPTLLDKTDPDLAEAAEELMSFLRAGADSGYEDAETTAVAAWSLVHGFATIALSGALQSAGFADAATDLPAMARRAAALIRGTT